MITSLGDLFRVIKEHSTDSIDRVEVAYWWLAEHHRGQNSWEYEALSRLSRVYMPGVCSNKPHNYEAFEAVCSIAECTHD